MDEIYSNREFKDISFAAEEAYGDDFEDCTFTHCHFEESSLRKCSFTDCVFNDCNVRSLTVRDCYMRDCSFIKCSLIGINFDDFTDAIDELSSPIEKMLDCTVKYSVFSRLNLIKNSFKNCSITDSSFLRCTCNSADFSRCDLNNTQFSECSLLKADFTGATGWIIPIETNSIKGARFSYPEVVNLLNGLGIHWE